MYLLARTGKREVAAIDVNRLGAIYLDRPTVMLDIDQIDVIQVGIEKRSYAPRTAAGNHILRRVTAENDGNITFLHCFKSKKRVLIL